MKKTFTINISGTMFHIDDDAFAKLQNYLDSLSRRYSGSSEGKEIIDDIEARIAELFRENKKWETQVISIDDVNRVIETMGEPNEFEEEIPNDETDSKERKFDSDSKFGKRLYRNPDDRIIGGIAGGLGAYLGLDPVIVRVLFILLAFTSIGIIIYIVLWIIMPVATTTAQKLEMEGKNVTISNIEQSINEEFKEVKNSFEKFRNSKDYKHGLNLFEKFMMSIGQIIKAIFKIVIVLLGIALIFLGISFIFGIFGSFFSVAWFVFPFEINQITAPEMFTWIADLENARILIIGIILLVSIPILSIIYGGFRLVFSMKSNKLVGFAAFIMWLLALIMTVSVIFIEGKNFKTKAIYKNKIELNSFSSSTILIASQPDTLWEYYNDYSQLFDFDQTKVFFGDANHQVFIMPEIDIMKSENNKIQIIEKRSSRGLTRNIAYENSEILNYEITQKNSLLTIGAYGNLPINKKWRAQTLKIIIKLPVGKKIMFDGNMKKILRRSNNIYGIWPNDLIDKEWEMTESGLKK